MKVKFSRCTSTNLTNVPLVDGQLVFVKDTSELYLDIGSNRARVEDKNLINRVNSIDLDISNLYDVTNIHTNNIADITNNIINIYNITNLHTTDISNLQNLVANMSNQIADLDNRIGQISNIVDEINGENI